MEISRYYLPILVLVSVFAMPLVFGQGNTNAGASTAISSSLCTIVNTVQTVIGVIALMLFILGGALYAIAHMLPAAGNLKGNVQGWALGMLVGGVVGLVIVIVAPGLIGIIEGVGGLTGIASCGGV